MGYMCCLLWSAQGVGRTIIFGEFDEETLINIIFEFGIGCVLYNNDLLKFPFLQSSCLYIYVRILDSLIVGSFTIDVPPVFSPFFYFLSSFPLFFSLLFERYEQHFNNNYTLPL